MDGSETPRPFSAANYEMTYISILELIEGLKQEPFHWEKFTTTRRAWAAEAK